MVRYLMGMIMEGDDEEITHNIWLTLSIKLELDGVASHRLGLESGGGAILAIRQISAVRRLNFSPVVMGEMKCIGNGNGVSSSSHFWCWTKFIMKDNER